MTEMFVLYLHWCSNWNKNQGMDRCNLHGGYVMRDCFAAACPPSGKSSKELAIIWGFMFGNYVACVVYFCIFWYFCLLACFFAFLLPCFRGSSLLCFSTFPLFCFSASLLLRLPASLLFCVSAFFFFFSFFLLLCFVAS